MKSGDIKTRKVEWTEEFEATIGCGHLDCRNCGETTPEPTNDEIITFVMSNEGDNFMWPDGQDWTPSGWRHVDGLLCPACVKVVDAALGKRKAKR